MIKHAKILFDELYVFDENPNQDENLERKELLELVYKEKDFLKVIFKYYSRLYKRAIQNSMRVFRS